MKKYVGEFCVTLDTMEDKARISAICDTVFCEAFASAPSNTTYNHPIPSSLADFYKAHMDEILENLRELFPNCHISHTLLTIGTNGKIYDVARIDDKELKFLNNTVLDNSYIVIDWS